MKRIGFFSILLVAAQARANLPKEVSQRTMPAVVFLLAADMQNGKLTPVASGSGTILTADGIVLTNRHVVVDEETGRLHDAIAIGMLKSFDQAPELTCIADPQHGIIDKNLDLAVIKCETDLSGKPYAARNWPTIPIGRSEDLQPGSSEVFVLGYPGVGGPTIHVTRGLVSGFLGEDGGAGRFWIKTDAAIAHGNSGGTAVDEEGRLVGIPTAVKPGKSDEGERVGLLRPIELVRPLLARAANGEVGRAGPAAGPEPGPGPGEVPKPGPPPKKHEGHGGWSTEPSGPTCSFSSGTVVAGRVVASDNGAPIEGAFVVILKPGVRRRQVKDQYANIDELAATYAISDQTGAYAMPCPIPRNERFTVIVVAKGFVELSSDGVLDTTGAPDRYMAWGGKVLLQRQD